MTATSPAPKPRRSRLQFSLRLLLLAFTAFAVGFPIWYRWPFEETNEFDLDPFATGSGTTTITRTWRRTWGGGKIQSGREIEEVRRGKFSRKTIRYYDKDQLHGKFEMYEGGKLIQTGQYERGGREGKWVEYDSSGKVVCTATWHEDLLDRMK